MTLTCISKLIWPRVKIDPIQLVKSNLTFCYSYNNYDSLSIGQNSSDYGKSNFATQAGQGKASNSNTAGILLTGVFQRGGVDVRFKRLKTSMIVPEGLNHFHKLSRFSNRCGMK